MVYYFPSKTRSDILNSKKSIQTGASLTKSDPVIAPSAFEKCNSFCKSCHINITNERYRPCFSAKGTVNGLP